MGILWVYVLYCTMLARQKFCCRESMLVATLHISDVHNIGQKFSQFRVKKLLQ